MICSSEWSGFLFVLEITKSHAECPVVLYWATFTVLRRTRAAL